MGVRTFRQERAFSHPWLGKWGKIDDLWGFIDFALPWKSKNWQKQCKHCVAPSWKNPAGAHETIGSWHQGPLNTQRLQLEPPDVRGTHEGSSDAKTQIFSELTKSAGRFGGTPEGSPCCRKPKVFGANEIRWGVRGDPRGVP